MNRFLRSACLVATTSLTSLLIAPAPAGAQGTMSLAAWGGIYVPTRNTYSQVGTDIKRRNSFIGGARFTYWGRSPFGLELTAGVSPARTTLAGATIHGDRDTDVFAGSGKLAVGLGAATSPVGLYLGIGPAIIRRGKDVLDQSTSVTDLGAALGIGLRLPIAPHLGFRIDAEDYLYGGDFDGRRKFQNDLVVSAGLSLSF